MKAGIIVNPQSGRRRAGELLRKLEAARAAADLETQVYLWDEPRAIDRLVGQALDEGCSALVAAGGDGTVHEVGIRLIGGRVPLGIIPIGTGNALAHHFGISDDLAACLRIIRSGHTLQIDTATVNGRPFLAFIGVGLDARIIERYAHVGRRGLLTYAWHSINQYVRYRPQAVRLETGDAVYDWKPTFVSVMNIQEFGLHARIAPAASAVDGRLDVVGVWVPGLWYAPVFGWRLFRGKLRPSRYYQRFDATRLVIERSSAGVVQIDGEAVELEARLTVEVVPASLPLLVGPQVGALPEAQRRPLIKG